MILVDTSSGGSPATRVLSSELKKGTRYYTLQASKYADVLFTTEGGLHLRFRAVTAPNHLHTVMCVCVGGGALLKALCAQNAQTDTGDTLAYSYTNHLIFLFVRSTRALYK